MASSFIGIVVATHFRPTQKDKEMDLV